MFSNEIKFIKDDYLNINKGEFKYLCYKYSQEEICNMLFRVIRDNNLGLPIDDFDLNTTVNCFKKLELFNTYNLLKNEEFDTKFEYDKKWFKYPYFIRAINKFNKSSYYFHINERLKTESNMNISANYLWYNDKCLKYYLRGIFTLKHKEVNKRLLYSLLTLRSSYIPAQFNVAQAKFIYEFFRGKIILDFSSGWGDRLAGFSACKNSEYYVGIDPNINTYNQYFNQIKTYNTNKKYKLLNLPAEEVDFDNLGIKFDLVFTSPPYFNCEKYGGDNCDNQSWNNYKNKNDWLQDFLFKTIEKIWKNLKDGGFFIINISDIYYKKNRIFLCDEMNEFFQSLDNSCYLGCIGLNMSKRVNSGIDDLKNFSEPIWIWSKGKRELKFNLKKKLF